MSEILVRAINSLELKDERNENFAELRRAIAGARRSEDLETVSGEEMRATWKFLLSIFSEVPLAARQVMEAAEALFSSEPWAAAFSDLEISTRRKFSLWQLKGWKKPAEILALALTKCGVESFFPETSDFQVIEKFPGFFDLVFERLPEDLKSQFPSRTSVLKEKPKTPTYEVPKIPINWDFEKENVLALLEACEQTFSFADQDLRNFQVPGTETVPKCLARACALRRREISDATCRAVLVGGCQSGKTLLSILLSGFPAPPVQVPSCVFVKYQHCKGLSTPQLTVPLDLVFLLSRLDPAAMAGEDLTCPVDGGEEISRLLGKINSILFQAKPQLLSGDFLEVFISLQFPGLGDEKFILVDTPSPDARIFRGPAQVALQVRRSLRCANYVFFVVDATSPEVPRGLLDLIEEAVRDHSIDESDVSVFLNKMDSLPFGPTLIRLNQFSEIFEISALRAVLAQFGKNSDSAFPRNFLQKKVSNFFPRLLNRAVSQAKFSVAEFLGELAILQSKNFAFSDSDASEIEAIYAQYAEDLRANLEISSLRELPSPAESTCCITRVFKSSSSQPVLEFLKNFAEIAWRDWQVNFVAAAAAAAEDTENLRPKWIRSVALFLRSRGAPAGVRLCVVSLFKKFPDSTIPGDLQIPGPKLNALILGRAKSIPTETRRTLFASEGLKQFEISETFLQSFLAEVCELFRETALQNLTEFFLKPANSEFSDLRVLLAAPAPEAAVSHLPQLSEFCEAVANFTGNRNVLAIT